MSRPGGSFAVLIGAVIGVTAAVARRGDDAPALPPPPAIALETPSAEPKPNPAPAELAASATSTPHAPTTALAATATTAPVASASAGAEQDLPPITSAAELQAVEVRCYAQDPLSCRRAARAYETGEVVPRDPDRAQNYRRVELTQLVRQCEKRMPRACLTLAALYAQGDGVAASPRRAEQLRKHARDLCQRRPSDDCKTLGLP